MEPDKSAHASRLGPPTGEKQDAPSGAPGGTRGATREDSSTEPLPRAREQSLRVERDLTDVFFRMLEERKKAVGERFPSPRTTLKLSLEIVPPGLGAPTGRLYEEIERAVDRCVADHAAFPLGRVYCHWCRSYDCDHSGPPDPRCVFRGYTPTGQPLWGEFMSVLLEMRHPGVDALVGSEPVPVALVQPGHELSTQQLAVYGKRSPIFQILAQVVLGYIPFPDGLSLRGSQGQRSPIAITFQAVVPGNGGRPPVLNILGRLPDGMPAFQALEESPDIRISDALRSVRRSLEEVPLIQSRVQRRRREGERRRRVLAILTRLARNLERIFRQRARRTQHAEDRHLNRQRPTSTALRDALHARPDAIYRDVEERTWVVLGPKNRVHVFNDDGLHVTSVTYSGDTVRQRTTRGKWLPARSEDLSGFLEALRRKAGGGVERGPS